MTLSLALPDVRDFTLSDVRDRLVPVCRLAREEIRAEGDLDGARELGRRLGAFRRLMADRKSRALVAAEERRTEVLVGHLLGEPIEGRPRKEKTSPIGEVSLDHNERHKFRLLATHEDLVETLLQQGYVTQFALLDKVRAATAARTPVGLSLATGSFTTIVADPPWQYDNRATRAAATNHYATLSVEAIAAFTFQGRPVSAWKAAAAHLYLWTTNAFLRQAFDVLEAWGFTYRTTLVWVKPQLGIGNYFRSSHEFILFGTSGGLAVKDSNQRSWFEAPRGRHSAKPEYFYDLVERVSPGPYLELFGRPSPMFGPRAGWSVWGDEA